MNNTFTATIRDRGQLTIPDRLREQLGWSQKNQIVTIQKLSDKSIKIGVFTDSQPIDWKQLRRQLNRVAKYKGQRGNLSQFIAEDRYRH